MIEALAAKAGMMLVLGIIAKILVTIFVAWVVIRVACHFVQRIFQKSARLGVGTPMRAETLRHLIDNVIKVAVCFIAVVTILSFLGVNVTSILATAGVLGLAIGFGAQTLVKDVISGFFIILENQYAIGEHVKVKGFEGYVEAIEMRVTRLRGLNGEEIIFANSAVTDVVNLSRGYVEPTEA